MSLTGNLESFPLAEVLRLAARTHQAGLLRVEAGGVQGRLFIQDGALTYGSTREEDDLGTELAKAGLIDPHKWYPVERGEEPIEYALMEGVATSDLAVALSDRLIDALIRLMRPKHGTFDFEEERSARYLSEQRIDVESCLAAAERRVAEWNEVEAVIPTVWRQLALNTEPPAPSMTITADTWRILAAMNGPASIEDVAERAGLSDFQTARIMAEMTSAGLLVLLEEDAPLAPAPDGKAGEPVALNIVNSPEPSVELLSGPAANGLADE